MGERTEGLEESGVGTRFSRRRIFLLSPANASGKKAGFLLGERGKSDLAVRLRSSEVPLSEIFTFISALYFRGKLAYAEAFANPPAGLGHALVITPSRGLLAPETLFGLEALRDLSKVEIDLEEERYVGPFRRHARLLAQSAGAECDVVLLGSVATEKYVGPLLEVFGERLKFPAAFVGRGDMSRGGMMLRAARTGEELEYATVAEAVRRGVRPPKLPKLARAKAGGG